MSAESLLSALPSFCMTIWLIVTKISAKTHALFIVHFHFDSDKLTHGQPQEIICDWDETLLNQDDCMSLYISNI